MRARLLRLARERGEDFSLVLTRYANERLLFRLASSRHAHRFVLKGAALFTLWTDEVRAKLLEHAPAAGEATMSMAEQWLREGLEQGRTEGREEGRRVALRQLLRTKFGALAPALEVRIAQATSAELDRYLERILVADSLAAVFAP